MKDLYTRLTEKPILGEFGAFNRPYVVIDVDEWQEILERLKPKTRRKKQEVPLEAVR